MLDLNIIKADTNYADVTFFKIPKSLFDEKIKKTGLSLGAKLLFTLIFDRVSLSIKSKWVNENNEVFVYFTQDEAMEYLECSKKTVAKFYNELEEKGLILRVHQGFSKASKIYVKDISAISTNTKKDVFKITDESIVEKTPVHNIEVPETKEAKAVESTNLVQLYNNDKKELAENSIDFNRIIDTIKETISLPIEYLQNKKAVEKSIFYLSNYDDTIHFNKLLHGENLEKMSEQTKFYFNVYTAFNTALVQMLTNNTTTISSNNTVTSTEIYELLSKFIVINESNNGAMFLSYFQSDVLSSVGKTYGKTTIKNMVQYLKVCIYNCISTFDFSIIEKEEEELRLLDEELAEINKAIKFKENLSSVDGKEEVQEISTTPIENESIIDNDIKEISNLRDASFFNKFTEKWKLIKGNEMFTELTNAHKNQIECLLSNYTNECIFEELDCLIENKKDNEPLAIYRFTSNIRNTNKLAI